MACVTSRLRQTCEHMSFISCVHIFIYWELMPSCLVTTALIMRFSVIILERFSINVFLLYSKSKMTRRRELRARMSHAVTSRHKFSENDLHADVHKIYFKYFTYFYLLIHYDRDRLKPWAIYIIMIFLSFIT